MDPDVGTAADAAELGTEHDCAAIGEFGGHPTDGARHMADKLKALAKLSAPAGCHPEDRYPACVPGELLGLWCAQGLAAKAKMPKMMGKKWGYL